MQPEKDLVSFVAFLLQTAPEKIVYFSPNWIARVIYTRTSNILSLHLFFSPRPPGFYGELYSESCVSYFSGKSRTPRKPPRSAQWPSKRPPGRSFSRLSSNFPDFPQLFVYEFSRGLKTRCALCTAELSNSFHWVFVRFC